MLDLGQLVGDRHVLTDPDVVAPYAVDWTGRWRGAPAAVVRPADAGEVAAVVRACAQAGVAIVPQGGNTGLVAGTMAPPGSVLLSLRRLDAIGTPDAASATLTAGAGATAAAVQATAQAAGLVFGVDLTTRESATVGGLAATNAGGAWVPRFGPMRDQVCGVQAVLVDGSVIDTLDGPLKRADGYDLAGLLCGSEGTLAIICALRLRLRPPPRNRCAALAAVADPLAAIAVARAAGAGVLAADGWGPAARALIDDPLDGAPGWRLLLELCEHEAPEEVFAAAFGDARAVVATDPAERARLWAVRERIGAALARCDPPPHKLDVALPPARLSAFVDALPDGAVVFGHLADANLHVNLLGHAPDDERPDRAVLELVAAHGGTVSAEHGIGRAKAAHLGLSRSPAELAALRAIKAALDPRGLLNPGVLVAP